MLLEFFIAGWSSLVARRAHKKLWPIIAMWYGKTL